MIQGGYLDVNVSKSDLRAEGMSLVLNFLCPSCTQESSKTHPGLIKALGFWPHLGVDWETIAGTMKGP